MAVTKILVMTGSSRAASSNVRLAALAAKEILIAEADVTRISLEDYPLPLFDGEALADSGPPQPAVQLKHMLMAHHGVFITSPEYNASVSPLIKNTIDWISRVRDRGESANAAFKNGVFALGSASSAPHGGVRALIALRQVLELGCGALVIPEQVAVPHAGHAFDDRDELRDEALAAALKITVRRLVEVAAIMRAG